jgi:hypothetical protein
MVDINEGRIVPNQSSEPAFSSVTPAAEQESRPR